MVDIIFNTLEISFSFSDLHPFSTSQLQLSDIQNRQLQPESGLSIGTATEFDDFFLADTIQF